MEQSLVRELFSAIRSSDTAGVRRIVSQHPSVLTEYYGNRPLLHYVAEMDDVETMMLLADHGIDINAGNKKTGDGPLTFAVSGAPNAVRWLLRNGADPNQGRLLIGAINGPDPKVAIEIVKLLIEHGADPNHGFPFGENGPYFNALTWAEANGKEEIAKYLRSVGAQPLEATEAEVVEPADDVITAEVSELSYDPLEREIVAYFEANAGPVQPLALQQTVRTDPPIAIHVVRPTKSRNYITLFTTGVSARPMTVPDGFENFRFAELTIDLPPDWPLGMGALADPNHRWPFAWLQWLGNYPHENQTHLGGPATIIANGDPPEQLAPNSRFTAILLLAESEIKLADDRLVQLYRLLPIYNEERELETREGIPALMRALDVTGMSSVVDIHRPNTAVAP